MTPAIRSRSCPAFILAAMAALCVGCGGSSGRASTPPPSPPPAAVPASATSHIVVLVMENKEDKDVLAGSGSPYIKSLARRYARPVNSFGITHPSLPNYLALTSGSTQGITSDCTDCRVRATNLVDQLEARRLSWKAYVEDLPRPCFDGASAAGGLYAKKHNPFMYYEDVASNPARCRNIVPLTRLSGDLRGGRLPAFSLITPNMCHDTHDCGLDAGDRFVKALVPSLLRGLGPHGFLVLTYDEGSSNAGCCGVASGGRIATIVAGPDVRKGFTDATPVDHYGVLRSIEDALGLKPLGGAADPRNGSLRRLFTTAPRVP
jgi:hypothetical protein